MHSSEEELENALQILAPKCVVSTILGCGALDLNKKKLSFSSLNHHSSIDLVDILCPTPEREERII